MWSKSFRQETLAGNDFRSRWISSLVINSKWFSPFLNPRVSCICWRESVKAFQSLNLRYSRVKHLNPRLYVAIETFTLRPDSRSFNAETASESPVQFSKVVETLYILKISIFMSSSVLVKMPPLSCRRFALLDLVRIFANKVFISFCAVFMHSFTDASASLQLANNSLFNFFNASLKSARMFVSASFDASADCCVLSLIILGACCSDSSSFCWPLRFLVLADFAACAFAFAAGACFGNAAAVDAFAFGVGLAAATAGLLPAFDGIASASMLNGLTMFWFRTFSLSPSLSSSPADVSTIIGWGSDATSVSANGGAAPLDEDDGNAHWVCDWYTRPGRPPSLKNGRSNASSDSEVRDNPLDDCSKTLLETSGRVTPADSSESWIVTFKADDRSLALILL